MNKQELMEKVETFRQTYGLSKDGFSITSGSALAMHDLREDTSDVDIEVGRGTLAMLCRCLEKHYGGIRIGNIEIQLTPGDREVVRIDGYLVVSLPDLLEHKEALILQADRSPEKIQQDHLDIAAIRQRLADEARARHDD